MERPLSVHFLVRGKGIGVGGNHLRHQHRDGRGCESNVPYYPAVCLQDSMAVRMDSSCCLFCIMLEYCGHDSTILCTYFRAVVKKELLVSI